MAHRIWDVEVFNVSEDIVSTPKYNKRVKIRADYDPQGISVKILGGMYGNRVLILGASCIIFLFLLWSNLGKVTQYKPVKPPNCCMVYYFVF